MYKNGCNDANANANRCGVGKCLAVPGTEYQLHTAQLRSQLGIDGIAMRSIHCVPQAFALHKDMAEGPSLPSSLQSPTRQLLKGTKDQELPAVPAMIHHLISFPTVFCKCFPLTMTFWFTGCNGKEQAS